LKFRLPFLAFASLSFALFGALLVLVGANQDALAASLELDLKRTGLLGSSLILGVGIGVLAAGPLADRFARRPLFLLAVAITGIALCSIEAEMRFSRALLHLLLAGIGGGISETILNTLGVERYRERSVRVVTLLHSAATGGAIALPLVVSGLAAANLASDFSLVFRAIGAAHLALGVLALSQSFDRPDAPESTRDSSRILTPTLIALCVAAFCYVGIESTLTVFAIPYATDGLGLDPERGRRAISLFWLGLLLGRLAFALRGPPDDARPAATAAGVAAVVLGAGVTLQWSSIEALVCVVGFALGSVFPLLVALAGRRTPGAIGSAVGLVAGLGSLGGFAIPWSTGLVGDRAGIAVAIGSLTFWCVVLGCSAIFAERAHDRRRRRR
jgi:fucose permease